MAIQGKSAGMQLKVLQKRLWAVVSEHEHGNGRKRVTTFNYFARLLHMFPFSLDKGDLWSY
jgi:hypothetical protein